jgi:hypothetical protein
MLEINKTHHMNFPHLSFSLPHQMQLATVTADDDELSQAIEADPIDHDNNWELVEHPDPGKLEAFWDAVVADVKNDPEWNTFAED